MEGRVISRIDFDPASQPLPRAELDRLLPLHPGAALSMDDVRAALKKLYLTGRYTDIQVDAEPDEARVALRVITTPAFFISGVTIEGEDDPPNRNQLVAATKLELGTPFVSADVETAVTYMLDRLKVNGFYNAKIQYKVDRNPETEEAAIHFEINTGDRARFAGVDLAGHFTRDRESVIRATRWRRGFGPIQFAGWRKLTDNRVQSGIQRVENGFQKGDHLEARVTLDDLHYEPNTNAVIPHLTIEGGPIIQVRVEGAKISGGRLRQLVPVYQERSVDRGLLVEGNRSLLEYFQAQGYFDAKVDYTEREPEKDRTNIDYSVTLGQRQKIESVEISGNHYFTAGTLRESMLVTPASVIRRRYGRYSQRLVDQDKDAILDLYRSNGFRDVTVTATVQDLKADQLRIKYEIVEGSQWFVNQLEIEGTADADQEHLRSIMESTAGQPFSETNVSTDRDAILSYYYNSGYPDATFDWTEAVAGDPRLVNLTYTIRPGKRQFVRGILLRGLTNTSQKLVDDRIQFAPGDPISQAKIGETQQKLYDLGIFSKVQTALQDPDGDEDDKYVLIHVDEANKYSFNAGLGAQLARIGGGVTTFDAPAGETAFTPRVTLGASRINFLGLGHTVGVQTLFSFFEQRALFTYLAPQFAGHENLSWTYSALFDDSHDVRTFDARRLEASVQLAQKISRARTLQYRYTIRRVTVDNLKISQELVPLLSQPDRAGLVSMTFIEDRRDDPTDTHRGMLNTIDVGAAWKWFGSDTDYTRILLRNSTYHQIGREIVIARTLQFGYIQRVGGLTDIPLAERFFSGGATSNRAFPDNQAGPRDSETGFPLGGNALLFHSTELRFPLFGDNVGGVLFHDMGNVYSDIDHISFRFRQQNLQDFNYMVQAIGFGIRYRTPVGPIRVDFSVSPNPPRFFGFQGSLDQLLAGQGVLTNQRINVFQFHFSLGQTF